MHWIQGKRNNACLLFMMHTPEKLRTLAEDGLNNLTLPSDPPELYEPVRYMINIGGKRIRPVLTLLSGEIFGEKPENLLDLAIAMELFHNFTLMHDDIMDNASIRRGRPTVHEKWGVNRAILSGDIMFALAYQKIREGAGKHFQTIFTFFNNTALKVCEGQQWDMNFENQKQVSLREYLNMIEHKTAYLLGASLKTGAMAANAGVEDQERVFNTGRSIGMAFQLKDDILDTFGSESKVGKNIGGDITANKQTILLVLAFEKAGKEHARQLHDWIQEKSNNRKHEKIEAVKGIYNTLNVKEEGEKLIYRYYEEARENLNKINVPDEQKRPLWSLIENLMGREH